MEKDTFGQNLLSATYTVLPFSQEFVINQLPSNCRYIIFPNQSYDKNPLEGDEQLFPEDSLSLHLYVGPYDAGQVVEYLWRNGKIPEWVNVSVYSYDAEF